MKSNTFRIGAAAALTMFSGAAAAQSSVTLYGTLDAFVYSRQLAGEGRVSRVDNGGLTTSNIGFRGTEDLGSGLFAAFDISSFLSLDNGLLARARADSAGVFARNAWVGLGSKDLGSVRLGRNVTPTFVNVLRFDPFSSSNFGAVLHTFVPSGGQPMLTVNGSVGVNASGAYAGADSAWSNSVAYVSPNVGGFVANVLVARDEGAAAPAAGDGTSASLVYSNGGLLLGASADRIKSSSSTLVRTKTDPAGAPYTVSGLRIHQFGAAYDFGPVKLQGQLIRANLQIAGGINDIRLNTTQLGATVPAGSGRVLVSWLQTAREQVGQNKQKRTTVSLGYDYDLSKRTDLYTVLMRDRATGLSGGTGFAFGIRHRF